MAPLLPIWRALLLLVLALLEGRMVFARHSEAALWMALLIGGAMLPAVVMPAGAAIAAFTALVPLLGGLERVGLLPNADPLLLFASAVVLGGGIRSLFRPQEIRPRFASHAFPLTLLYTLASAVILSAVLQGCRYGESDGSIGRLLDQPAIPYSDSLYWIAAAHLWLVGLLSAGEWLLGEPRSAIGLRVTFVIYVVVIAAFTVLQFAFLLPETQLVWANSRMLTSPYEDIHSLGAVTVSLFAGALVIFCGSNPGRKFGLGVAVLALFLVCVATWSRATWLAGMLAIAFVVFRRVSPRGRIVSLTIGVVLLVAGNVAARTDVWQRNQYLWRLGTLIRFENPLAKDGVRIGLYRKAVRIVAERPLTGLGIGSFYRQSPRYAAPGDPVGAQPNFAHNVLLQFAAELGAPLALLLLFTMAWPAWLAIRASTAISEQPIPVVALGVALAIYLLTQLTANALNIYLSNQLYFWPLWAALVTTSRQKAT